MCIWRQWMACLASGPLRLQVDATMVQPLDGATANRLDGASATSSSDNWSSLSVEPTRRMARPPSLRARGDINPPFSLYTYSSCFSIHTQLECVYREKGGVVKYVYLGQPSLRARRGL